METTPGHIPRHGEEEEEPCKGSESSRPNDRALANSQGLCPCCGRGLLGNICENCGPSGPVTDPQGHTLGGGLGGSVYEQGGVPLGSEGTPSGVYK